MTDQGRTVLGVIGIYLLIFGLLGGAWSFRAAASHFRYEKILSGSFEPEVELRQARRAFHLYPRHYSLCIRAAETAFTAAERAQTAEQADFFRQEAEYWAGRGLDLNPWLIELHDLRSRLLAKDSPAAAVDAWKHYVDWHFWDPANLERLARLQEAAGMRAEAAETLDYLRPWPQHDAWRERLKGEAGVGKAAEAP